MTSVSMSALKPLPVDQSDISMLSAGSATGASRFEQLKAKKAARDQAEKLKKEEEERLADQEGGNTKWANLKARRASVPPKLGVTPEEEVYEFKICFTFDVPN